MFFYKQVAPTEPGLIHVLSINRWLLTEPKTTSQAFHKQVATRPKTISQAFHRQMATRPKTIVSGLS